MRSRSLWQLSISAALAAAAPAAAQADTPARVISAGHKVTAPVELELTSTGQGDARRLVVLARPRVDAPALTVSVEVEDGLSLPAAAEWKGAAHQGQEWRQELDARISGAGEQRVVVTATLSYEDGSTQTAVQVFVLNPGAPVRGFARMPSRDVVSGPGGRRVVEVMTGRP
jgi:hypothetical protein